MTTLERQLLNIHPLLERAKRVVCINPSSPDGDSIGSALAFRHFFDRRGQECSIFAAGRPPSHYDYLPGIEVFSDDLDDVDLHGADLVIAVDFADPKMSGIEEHIDAYLQRGKPLLVIDHHPTNTNFGTHNIVDPSLASTTEIIYQYLEQVRHPIDKDIATCLLTGIVTDTSSFKNLNTTFSVIHAASRLLTYGARLRDITVNTAQGKSFPSLKLWGLALSRLTKHPELNIAWTIVSKDDLKQHNAAEEDVDGIANFLNNLSGANAVLVLRQYTESEIKGSLRTTVPGVDVARLAQIFGGGGHKKASGFTIQGKLVETPEGWRIE